MSHLAVIRNEYLVDWKKLTVKAVLTGLKEYSIMKGLIALFRIGRKTRYISLSI